MICWHVREHTKMTIILHLSYDKLLQISFNAIYVVTVMYILLCGKRCLKHVQQLIRSVLFCVSTVFTSDILFDVLIELMRKLLLMIFVDKEFEIYRKLRINQLLHVQGYLIMMTKYFTFSPHICPLIWISRTDNYPLVNYTESIYMYTRAIFR